jgi:acetolactate synthase-1/2/3 large subunit
MLQYGIYPSVVEEALGQLGDRYPAAVVVRSLLSRASGEPDGLALALIARAGPERFAHHVAALLNEPVDEVTRAVLAYYASAGDFRLTGAEAVALALADAGVQVAFAFAGTSELAVCDSFARIPGVRLINGRGDKECAFMAAGAGLLHPLRGVAVLHAARGLTNATGAVADARRNEVGTLFIVGLPSTASARFLPPHGEAKLLESIGNFVKWWHQADPVPAETAAQEEAAEGFLTALRMAVRLARTHPIGPTMFGLPQDVAERSWIPWSIVTETRQEDSARGPVPSSLREAARVVAGSRRALILIDDYALRYAGARPAIARFAAAAEAPVLQVRYRRGPMLFERLSAQDVPSFLGWFNQCDPFQQDLLERADLLVTVEDRNIYKRVVGNLPTCRKLAITSDGEKVRKNEYLSAGDLLVEGDPVEVLHELTLAVAAIRVKRPGAWWEGLLRSAQPFPTEGEATPEVKALRSGIVGVLANTLAGISRPVLVDDSQMFGGLICEEYDQLPSTLRVFGDHGGFVGGGLALALGLAIGEPKVHVFCTLGDQAFINGIQGLIAAGQERPQIVYLVCNNGESVSLLKQAGASEPRWFDRGHHPHLSNPVNIEYTRVAEAFGIRNGRVDFPIGDGVAAVEKAVARFRGLLADMATTSGPSLIELRLPARGAAWAGIWLTQGFDEDKARYGPGPDCAPRPHTSSSPPSCDISAAGRRPRQSRD